MALEMLIILFIIIACLVSFCNLLLKMKQHYEAEVVSSMNRRNTPPFVEIEQGFNSSSVFPDDTLPPAYAEVDLPPKYEDVVDKRFSLPQVHLSSIENNQKSNEISIIITK